MAVIGDRRCTSTSRWRSPTHRPARCARSWASGSLVAAGVADRRPTCGLAGPSRRRSSAGSSLPARAPRRPHAARCSASGSCCSACSTSASSSPHVVLLREPAPTGWRWVLFTVFVAMGSDSGGYFAGRAFGRRKLMPAVSPSKTVEGALGAVAGAVLHRRCCAGCVFFRALGAGEALGLGAVDQRARAVRRPRASRRSSGPSAPRTRAGLSPATVASSIAWTVCCFPFVFAYYYAALAAAAEVAAMATPVARHHPARVRRRARRARLRARARALRRRQAPRREGAALLDRLRAGHLLARSAARPSTRSPRCRSAAT